MKLNKKTWSEYSFGDVAIQQKESVEREGTDLDKYIAGEHMSTEDLHIRKWGVIGEDYLGPAFHRKFSEGDILYGSRRTYLKKVAVAHFDGITANTTFVIKANEKIIEPKILPFLMLSDSFTDHSVKNSKGSVNPYINWKDIANYKFKLPPLPEQKRLADLLWSVDEVIEKYKYSLNELKTLKASKTKQLFCNVSDELIELGNLCIEKPSYGATASAVEFKEGMPRYIRITDISEEGNLMNAEIKGIGTKDFEKYRLKEGDLLIARTAAVGRAFVYKEEYGDCVYAGYLIKFKLNEEKVLPEYVFSYLQSPIFQDWIRKTTRTGLQANINAKEYSDHKVPTPSLKVQEGIINQIDELKTMECGLLKQINMLENIKKGLINQIFA